MHLEPFHHHREIKPAAHAGQDLSIPNADDHALHLEMVFASDRRGFAFGVSPRAYSRTLNR